MLSRTLQESIGLGDRRTEIRDRVSWRPSPDYSTSFTKQGLELSVGYSERWVGSIRRLIT